MQAARPAPSLVTALAVVVAASMLALAPGCDVGPEEPEERAVEVLLHEFEIVMPSEIEEGPVTLSVVNAGSRPHDLEIDGQGMRVSLPGALQMGERRTLELELRPGTYRVWCPMPEHADLGMVTTLTVMANAAPRPEEPR